MKNTRQSLTVIGCRRHFPTAGSRRCTNGSLGLLKSKRFYEGEPDGVVISLGYSNKCGKFCSTKRVIKVQNVVGVACVSRDDVSVLSNRLRTEGMREGVGVMVVGLMIGWLDYMMVG